MDATPQFKRVSRVRHLVIQAGVSRVNAGHFATHRDWVHGDLAALRLAIYANPEGSILALHAGG